MNKHVGSQGRTVLVPYGEVSGFETQAELGPVSLVLAEDPELGLRDRGVFLPGDEMIKHGHEVMVSGILGKDGSEIVTPVVASIDFGPQHGIAAAVKRRLGRPRPPIAIRFTPNE